MDTFTVVALRRRLETARYGEWDRELAELVGDGGGRGNREPRLPLDREM